MSPGRRLLGLVLMCLTAGCTQPDPTDPAQVAVARLGDRPLTLEEFQRYLDRNLVADDEPGTSDSEEAAVKSRLFDAFMEERLLLLEADRRDVPVSDLEVEAYLALGGMYEADREASATRSDWEEARRRLKIEKLVEAAIRDLPPLSDDAMAAADGPAHAPDGRRLRFRALMLESPEVAARVSRDIRRGRQTFAEAVVVHATAPEQGQPVELSWDSLSEEHRAVLRNLKPGQVSQPLDVGGGTYLFQVEAWLGTGRPDAEVAAERARLHRERLRQAEALRALLSKLPKSVEIRRNLEVLPFTYVPDDSVDPIDWNTVIQGPG